MLNMISNMFLTTRHCQICNLQKERNELYSCIDLRDIDLRFPRRFIQFTHDYIEICRACFDKEESKISLVYKKAQVYDEVKVKYEKLEKELQQCKKEIQEKERALSFTEFTSQINLDRLKQYSKVFEELSVSFSETYLNNNSPNSVKNLQIQMKHPTVSLVQAFNESSKQYFVSSLDNLESIVKRDILAAEKKCQRLSGVKDSIKKSFKKEFDDGILKQESFHKMEEELKLELKTIEKQELLQRINFVRDKILQEFLY